MDGSRQERSWTLLTSFNKPITSVTLWRDKNTPMFFWSFSVYMSCFVRFTKSVFLWLTDFCCNFNLIKVKKWTFYRDTVIYGQKGNVVLERLILSFEVILTKNSTYDRIYKRVERLATFQTFLIDNNGNILNVITVLVINLEEYFRICLQNVKMSKSVWIRLKLV